MARVALSGLRWDSVAASTTRRGPMTAYTTREIALDTVTLHAAEQGEGPLVLLVHGWPECHRSWRHQIAALAEAGYRVVAPDLRGFGGASCPGGVAGYYQPH